MRWLIMPAVLLAATLVGGAPRLARAQDPGDAMDARREAIERWHESRRAWLEARRQGLLDMDPVEQPGTRAAARPVNRSLPTSGGAARTRSSRTRTPVSDESMDYAPAGYGYASPYMGSYFDSPGPAGYAHAAPGADDYFDTPACVALRRAPGQDPDWGLPAVPGFALEARCGLPLTGYGAVSGYGVGAGWGADGAGYRPDLGWGGYGSAAYGYGFEPNGYGVGGAPYGGYGYGAGGAAYGGYGYGVGGAPYGGYGYGAGGAAYGGYGYGAGGAPYGGYGYGAGGAVFGGYPYGAGGAAFGGYGSGAGAPIGAYGYGAGGAPIGRGYSTPGRAFGPNGSNRGEDRGDRRSEIPAPHRFYQRFHPDEAGAYPWFGFPSGWGRPWAIADCALVRVSTPEGAVTLRVRPGMYGVAGPPALGAVLRQRLVAGAGLIVRSESGMELRVPPWTPVGELRVLDCGAGR